MPASLTVLRLVVALGLTTGVGLAYWQPRGPLLGYWLLLSIALGVAVYTARALAGLARRFTVAQSTILSTGTDWVAIVDPSGAVVDTLRLAGDGVKSTTSNSFSLR